MSFAVDLRRLTNEVKTNLDQVVRKVVLDIGTKLVERSPVGDRELWAINQQILNNSANRTKSGILKAGARRQLQPKGYVGGRFRANWQYGFGTPANGVLHKPSPPKQNYPGPQQIIDILRTSVYGSQVAGLHYISNNLPYARRLEDGWSKQSAPSAMVGLTVLEFNSFVDAAVVSLKGAK